MKEKKFELFGPSRMPLTTFELSRITLNIIDFQDKYSDYSTKKVKWANPS